MSKPTSFRGSKEVGDETRRGEESGRVQKEIDDKVCYIFAIHAFDGENSTYIRGTERRETERRDETR